MNRYHNLYGSNGMCRVHFQMKRFPEKNFTYRCRAVQIRIWGQLFKLKQISLTLG